MADGARQDVLGQKAQAAQRAFEARGMSPSKALRRALSRTADVLWDLALVTQGVSVEMHDQDGVIDGLGPKDLLVLLDGPDGALGIASIEREIMTGVIEVQTIMQVTQMPVDEDRVLTPTDAAMMAPLLDGTLEKLVSNLDHHPLCAQLEGFRFGAMIEDARAASLLLDASSYRTFRADVDLALGRRKGALTITLPERVNAHKDTTNPDGTHAPGPHEELIGKIPARLDTVLTRLTMTLAQARNLKPGDLLPLPPDVLDRVEVIAGHGQVIAKGRLGQLHNQRAVRLTWPLGEVQHTGDMGEILDGGAGEVAPPMAELPAFEHEPVLPDTGAVDLAAEDQMGDLPDLPSMDFEADTGAFDMDLGVETAEDDGAMMADLGDFDFGAESLEIEES